eukprot:4193076-Amphidinium_carterae.1
MSTGLTASISIPRSIMFHRKSCQCPSLRPLHLFGCVVDAQLALKTCQEYRQRGSKDLGRKGGAGALRATDARSPSPVTGRGTGPENSESGGIALMLTDLHAKAPSHERISEESASAVEDASVHDENDEQALDDRSVGEEAADENPLGGTSEVSVVLSVVDRLMLKPTAKARLTSPALD